MTNEEFATQRQQLGISQRALADKLGVTDRMVSRYETGRSKISSSMAKKMALLSSNPICPTCKRKL